MTDFHRRLMIAALLAWPLAALPAGWSPLAQVAHAQAEAQDEPEPEASPDDAAPAPGEADAAEGDVDDQRVITIDSSGGTQSGNLRYGPIEYRHPDPEGITATVSNLTIFAPQATLRAPEDTLIARAKGSRTASFGGDVRVTRGRMEATGPALVYSEATGLGVLSGGAEVRIEPQEEDQETTFIDASEVEFDVDTDRSVSRDGVVLRSGNQRAEADELTYAEERDLGRLLCETRCTVIREDEDGSELRITAEEIRVLTASERLWARGDAVVVDASITTRGDTVFFDDEEAFAEVLGAPAVSVDEANGVRLESDRIRQDIEFDYVEAIDASAPSSFDVEAFRFAGEDAAAAPAAR